MERADVELPSYPPLHSCVLVDARHSSRIQVREDVRASRLFNNIVEASSLQDGIEILKTEEADACLIGPSVTAEKIGWFVSNAREAARSKDCAFIAIVREEESAELQLKENGAHAVLRYPYSLRALHEHIVSAVREANQTSGREEPSAAALPEESNVHRAATYIRSSSAGLQHLLEGAKRGEYLLNPLGNPTDKTRQAIRQVVAEALKDAAPLDPGTIRFEQFFDAALRQWFVDLIMANERVARDNLKNALLAYDFSGEEAAK